MKIKALFLVLFFSSITTILLAQTPPLPPTPAGVPIDDGGYVLLASGAIYSYYKFKQKRKKAE